MHRVDSLLLGALNISCWFIEVKEIKYFERLAGDRMVMRFFFQGGAPSFLGSMSLFFFWGGGDFGG